MPFDIVYHPDDVQHPILHLPFQRVGATRVRHVYPPLCPQGHPLESPNVAIGNGGRGLIRVSCRTCWSDDTVEHDTWYVRYPDWDRERQEWVWPSGL